MAKYLTSVEVAEVLRISAYTVREWIRDGKLRASKIGKAYLVSDVDLFKFVESKRTKKQYN